MNCFIETLSCRRVSIASLAGMLVGLSLQANEPFDARAWIQAGQGGPVNAVAVSTDGQWIATANDDATVKIWQAADGRLARTLSAGTFQSTALTFFGTNTLAAGYYDGCLRFWSPTSSVPIRTINITWVNNFIGVSYTNLNGKISALTATPNGQRVVSGGGDWFIRVWNTSTGASVASTVRQRGPVLAAAASPDGTRVALGSADASIVVLNASTWTPVRTNYHSSNVVALAYSPDGSRLASAGLDRTIRLWRTSDWGLDRTLTNDTQSVLCLGYSTNSQTLFTGDETGMVKARESASSWAVTRSWPAHDGAARCLAVAPDGTYVVSGGADHQVRTWGASDGSLLTALTGHGGRIIRLVHSPDGACVASAADDGTVRLWESGSGDVELLLDGHTNQVSAMAFSPDATVLATGGGCLDNNVLVWRRSDGALLRTIPAFSNGVNALAISPDRVSIASAGDRDEAVIRIWNLTDGSLDQEWAGDTNGTAVLAYSPDGSRLAVGGQFNDGRVMLWNVSVGTASQIGSHAGGVQSVAFNPSGTLVASAGRTDNLVKVWQTDGTPVCTLTNLALGAKAVAFSPNGALLAAAGSDRIQFWQSSTWLPVWSYTNEMFKVSSFAFSPNGTFFVVGREDGTVGRLWNPQATAVTLALGIQPGSPGSQPIQIQNPDYSPFLSVQRSSDLIEWVTLTNLVAGTNLVWAVDATAAGVPVRFYRATAPE